VALAGGAAEGADGRDGVAAAGGGAGLAAGAGEAGGGDFGGGAAAGGGTGFAAGAAGFAGAPFGGGAGFLSSAGGACAITIESPGAAACATNGRISSAVPASKTAAADLLRGRGVVEREFMMSHISWRDVVGRI
jgi:hypothetical protein